MFDILVPSSQIYEGIYLATIIFHQRTVRWNSGHSFAEFHFAADYLYAMYIGLAVASLSTGVSFFPRLWWCTQGWEVAGWNQPAVLLGISTECSTTGSSMTVLPSAVVFSGMPMWLGIYKKSFHIQENFPSSERSRAFRPDNGFPYNLSLSPWQKKYWCLFDMNIPRLLEWIKPNQTLVYFSVFPSSWQPPLFRLILPTN